MASIGEQIREARKAKGITQDALAEAMNVSRQAVSHWETNRTMPDAETLIRLSKVLEHSFEAAGAEQPAAEASGDQHEDAGQPAPVSSVSEGPAGAVKPPRRKALYIIGAAALALVVLCVCLLVVPALTNKTTAKERAYKSPVDGETYTIARFQQEAANDAGKAYLMINPALKINHGENYDYWMWDIACHEMNGVAFSVDRIEQVIFAKEKENVEQMITAADMRAYGMETDIPANGDWSYQGGLPVQDTVSGVGVLLRGTDANGAALAFATYIPLLEK